MALPAPRKPAFNSFPFLPLTAEHSLFQCGDDSCKNELLQGPLGMIRHFRAKHASQQLCPRMHCLFADKNPDSMQSHRQAHEYYDTRAEHNYEGRLLARCDYCEVSEVMLEQHIELKWHMEILFYSQVHPVPSMLPSLPRHDLNRETHIAGSYQPAVDSAYSSRLQPSGIALYAPSVPQQRTKLQSQLCAPIAAGYSGQHL
jgi:hypothetical protein